MNRLVIKGPKFSRLNALLTDTPLPKTLISCWDGQNVAAFSVRFPDYLTPKADSEQGPLGDWSSYHVQAARLGYYAMHVKHNINANKFVFTTNTPCHSLPMTAETLVTNDTYCG